MHVKQSLPLLLILAFLFLVGAACQSTGSVTMPCQPVVSQEAANRFNEKTRSLFEEGSGPFSLETTSDEVTSFLVLFLEEYQGESPLEDPRICFSAGEVYVAGLFTRVVPFDLRATVVATPRLVDGRVELDIVRASAGSIALPGMLLRAISKTINQTLAEYDIPMHFTMLEVGEDRITVGGQR